MTKFLLLPAAMCFFPCASLGDNLIVNPGFETGSATPWVLDFADQNPSVWKVSPSEVHSGQFALLADNWPKRATQTFVPVAGTHIFQVSFWAKQTNPYRIMGELLYTDGTIDRRSFDITNTNFNFYDLTPFLNRSKTLIGISVHGWASGTPGNTDTFFDDFMVSTLFVRISKAGSNPVVEFNGILQRSSNLTNWEDVEPQPSSPWTFIPSDGKAFFRVRSK